MRDTTLCYIEHQDKILMLHRTKKNKDPNKDKWIGVGGKVEPGESSEQCVVREVFEETGLTLNSYCYRGIVNFFSDIYEDEVMFLYTSDDYSGQISECNEGELAWIERDQIMSLNLWEGDRIFLKKILENDEEFFVLNLYYEGDKLIKWSYE